jgi:predicted MFS family arabinose efflux permease
MFLRRFRESNFVKFIFYVSSITFATQLSSPYFSVYMIRDLHFGYLEYTYVHLASMVSGLFAFPVWGRHADLVGNAKILKITSFVIPVIPILWIFNKYPLYLVLVETFSGIIWGGFNLCTTNFIYDAVSPDKRVRCLSYFNLINGTAAFAGASLGGLLADKLPPANGSALLSLFLLSGVLRFFADFILSRHFREVREETHPASSVQLFFSVLGIRPMIGRISEWNTLPSEEQERLGRIRSRPRAEEPVSVQSDF